MASEPSKQPAAAKRPAGAASPSSPAPPNQQTPPSIPKPPPLFRRIDWIAFIITFVSVLVGYLYTLAPDLTLQDSGELAVGSFYAGVPHPPGYPVWTIYTWFFTKILPFSNVAFRVGVSSAFAGALACGLITLMVSRGSSMFIESVTELKNIQRSIESGICLVSGLVAGLLMGFNGFMWSQSVIVEVYSLSMLGLTGGVICLLHWAYAPHQYRYLYLAWFLCGISVNNHQSLFVITIAMEVLMIATQARLGRQMLLWNSIFYLLGIIAYGKGGFSLLSGNTPLLLIFSLVGLASILGYIWLSIVTKVTALELMRDALLVFPAILLIAAFSSKNPVSQQMEGPGQRLALEYLVFAVLVYFALDFFFWLRKRQLPWLAHWRKAVTCGIGFVVGAAFYLYMPLTSMTNPPLNWGYPRTVGGFIHAFTRGQYERIHPTAGSGNNVVENVGSWVATYSKQVKFILIDGSLEEFSLGYLLLAVVPLAFFRRLQPRERAWLLGLVAFYFVLGPFLLELFNPAPDRQSLSLNKPFFIASHVFLAMAIGYGLTLLLAALATAYEKILLPVLIALIAQCLFSLWNIFHIPSPLLILWAIVSLVLGIAGVVVVSLTFIKPSPTTPEGAQRNTGLAMLALLIGLFGLSLWDVAKTFHDTPYNVAHWTCISGLALAVLALLVMIFNVVIPGERAPVMPLLLICAAMPIYSVLGHWSDNEQRGHLYGYWFGHDMFTPPFKGKDYDKTHELSYSRKEREELLKTPEGQKTIYPEMARDTILFGGTDPGRFCPTYMIFCESFIPPKDKPRDPEFDRRDVYIITQNALADGTYLQYIRAHYNRSTEPDRPFFSELLRSDKERELNFKTNLLAKMFAVPLDDFFLANGARIEKERRVGNSFFKPDHFTHLPEFAKKLEQGAAPSEVSKYLRDHLSENTRKLLGTGGGKLADSLAEDLNKILDDEWKGNLELSALRSELTSIEGQLGDAGISSSRKNKLTKRKEELTKQINYYSGLVPFYTAARFQGVTLNDHIKEFIKEGPTNHTRIRFSRLLLEAAYPGDLAISQGGVYPDTEIHTPSNEDSQRCFQEYMADAQERMRKGALRPGEDVRIVDNRVQVSGQVAVMAINALLAKVIFDQNPNNEFYVEESFPLEWMYPHLTPFGIIMKINRQQLPELTQDIVDKDHKFWSDYSERLIGNWITYDTPVSNITQFAERVYVNKNYNGFKGDPAFVRDEDGQKAFSKLRSSIAGVYAWRIANQTSGRAMQIEARLQANPQSQLTDEERHLMEVHNRMFREAEFAFKQAYAFCPYSPEALYRYVQLLAGARRFDDALLLAQTSHDLDPANAGLDRLVDELKKMKVQAGSSASAAAQAEMALRANPNDLQTAGALAQMYASQGRTADVLRIADTMVANPKADAPMISFAAQIYQQLLEYPRLEKALARWVQVTPTPEAWLDYAASQAVQRKNAEAIKSLRQALAMSSARMQTNAKAENLAKSVPNDARFASLKGNSEFEQLIATNK